MSKIQDPLQIVVDRDQNIRTPQRMKEYSVCKVADSMSQATTTRRWAKQSYLRILPVLRRVWSSSSSHGHYISKRLAEAQHSRLLRCSRTSPLCAFSLFQLTILRSISNWKSLRCGRCRKAKPMQCRTHATVQVTDDFGRLVEPSPPKWAMNTPEDRLMARFDQFTLADASPHVDQQIC
jgi:hypothetical protein